MEDSSYKLSDTFAGSLVWRSRPQELSRKEEGERVLNRWKLLVGRAGDLVVNLTLVFPVIIAFWRGVWQLVDCYGGTKPWDPWISLTYGYLVPTVLYVVQDPLKNLIAPNRLNYFMYNLLSRLLLLLHASANVNQWRGLWKLLDVYTGLDWKSASLSILLGLSLSLPFRTFSSAITPPLFCAFDDFPGLHESPLRFRSGIKSSGFLQFTLDCLFTVVVSLSGVICCWRGLWVFLDLYLYPDHPQLSMEASLVSGYAICTLMCVLQPLLCESQSILMLKGVPRVVLAYLSYIVGFIGSVLAWRGLWNFYNIYVTFSTPCLSEWVTTVLGGGGGILMGCMSTIIVRLRPLDMEIVEDWLIPSVTLGLNPQSIIPKK